MEMNYHIVVEILTIKTFHFWTNPICPLVKSIFALSIVKNFSYTALAWNNNCFLIIKFIFIVPKDIF